MPTDENLSIERREGKTPDVLIFKLSGPITTRTLFDLQADLRAVPDGSVTILDMTEVPYLDSGGIGVVINHYVHGQKTGGKLIVAAVNSRALELFKLTKVDTLIQMTGDMEEAERMAVWKRLNPGA